jgi:hypothetical protein
LNVTVLDVSYSSSKFEGVKQIPIAKRGFPCIFHMKEKQQLYFVVRFIENEKILDVPFHYSWDKFGIPIVISFWNEVEKDQSIHRILPNCRSNSICDVVVGLQSLGIDNISTLFE